MESVVGPCGVAWGLCSGPAAVAAFTLVRLLQGSWSSLRCRRLPGTGQPSIARLLGPGTRVTPGMGCGAVGTPTHRAPVVPQPRPVPACRLPSSDSGANLLTVGAPPLGRACSGASRWGCTSRVSAFGSVCHTSPSLCLICSLTLRTELLNLSGLEFINRFVSE